MFHGLEDLPPDEREHYQRQQYFRQGPTEQINRYVPVKESNHLARGFCESIAREIEFDPSLAPILQRVENHAKTLAHGYQVSQRLGVNANGR